MRDKLKNARKYFKHAQARACGADLVGFSKEQERLISNIAFFIMLPKIAQNTISSKYLSLVTREQELTDNCNGLNRAGYAAAIVLSLSIFSPDLTNLNDIDNDEEYTTKFSDLTDRELREQERYWNNQYRWLQNDIEWAYSSRDYVRGIDPETEAYDKFMQEISDITETLRGYGLYGTSSFDPSMFPEKLSDSMRSPFDYFSEVGWTEDFNEMFDRFYPDEPRYDLVAEFNIKTLPRFEDQEKLRQEYLCEFTHVNKCVAPSENGDGEYVVIGGRPIRYESLISEQVVDAPSGNGYIGTKVYEFSSVQGVRYISTSAASSLANSFFRDCPSDVSLEDLNSFQDCGALVYESFIQQTIDRKNEAEATFTQANYGHQMRLMHVSQVISELEAERERRQAPSDVVALNVMPRL